MSRIRQQEKARQSKEGLLKAAETLFAGRKISDVGVREISAEAGVTTGTFYHYFTGKDDILHQIYHSHDEDMGQILHTLAGQPGGYCVLIRNFFQNIWQGRFWPTAGNLPVTGYFRCARTAQMKTACISACRN